MDSTDLDLWYAVVFGAMIAFAIALPFLMRMRFGRRGWRGERVAGRIRAQWSLPLFLLARRRRLTFVCSRMPFIGGEKLEGFIEARDLQIDADVKATIACMYDRDRDSWCVWAGDVTTPRAAIAHIGEGGVRIPLSCRLPDDLRPSGAATSWLVVLHLPRLDVRFEVPVIAATDDRRERYPAVAELRCTVTQPADAEIVVPQKPRGDSAARAGNAVVAITLAVFLIVVGVHIAFQLAGIAYALFAIVNAARPRNLASQSVIHIRDGDVVFTGDDDKTQQHVKASSIRAVDVTNGGSDLRHMTWRVRLHTIGGKTFIAARFVPSKAEADAIAVRVHDALTALDRRQLDRLFGSGNGLHSAS